MKRFYLIIFLMAIALSFGAPLISAEENKEAMKIDAAFVIGKCTQCHTIGKICSRVGKKSDVEWMEIVQGMVKKGASLNDSEQKSVADFIVNLPSGKNQLCP
jgi:hypothetical protein